MMSTMNMNTDLARFLSNNEQWANDVAKYEPAFFEESAKGQSPKVLWFGCADSRVPESVVMACKPGEIFVHRNIANQFHLKDDSAQSVLTYAVQHLGVEHVVVVGHTMCGGVLGAHQAACSLANSSQAPESTPLTRWLTPLIELASKQPTFQPCIETPPSDVLTTLSEANIRTQVANIVETDVIRSSWTAAQGGNGKRVYVHGWIYDLGSGRLKDLGVSEGPEGRVGKKFLNGITNGVSNGVANGV